MLGLRTATEHGPPAYKATVTVDASAASVGQIGPRYIGLSFESGILNSGKFDNVGNLPRLLKNLGGSVLRFGGYSVDTSYTGISPSALQGLVRLTDASGWSVLYSENLGKFDAASVTADASAVSAALGPKLVALACGNEPDRFMYNGIRPAGYNASFYVYQANACLQAVRAGAPGVPLEGPDMAYAPDWTAEYASREAGAVSMFGLHYYPLGCAQSSQNPADLVGKMLSPELAGEEASVLDSYAAYARTAGAPLILSETNSACNGGIKGLSDSYASALWVIDYILTGAEHGVRMMNFHGGLDTYCQGYTPLCEVGANSYRAQPVYYGMLFAHMLGSGELLPAKVTIPVKKKPARGAAAPGATAAASASATATAPATAPATPSAAAPARVGNIAAFALRPSGGGGLRLMVENLSKDQANTTLRVSSNPGKASVLRLTGPAPLATSGVRVQGASVSGNGAIKPGQPETVQCTERGCTVTLPPYSAAVVTFG